MRKIQILRRSLELLLILSMMIRDGVSFTITTNQMILPAFKISDGLKYNDRNNVLRFRPSSSLSLIPDSSIIETTTTAIASLSDIITNEEIKKAFGLATFGPQVREYVISSFHSHHHLHYNYTHTLECSLLNDRIITAVSMDTDYFIPKLGNY